MGGALLAPKRWHDDAERVGKLGLGGVREVELGCGGDREQLAAVAPLPRPLEEEGLSRASACAASTRCSAIACVRMTILPSAAAVDISVPKRPEPELSVEGRKL